MKNDELELFIGSIREGVKVLKEIPLKHKRRGHISYSLGKCIQRWSYGLDFNISVEAYKITSALNVDYKKLNPNKPRLKVGGEKHQSKILLEHNLPICQIVEMLVEAPLEEIENILRDNMKVSWITREENNRLNKNKWSRKRPKNAYELCEIFLVD